MPRPAAAATQSAQYSGGIESRDFIAPAWDAFNLKASANFAGPPKAEMTSEKLSIVLDRYTLSRSSSIPTVMIDSLHLVSMNTMGERLAWARNSAGYKSARSAALDNGWVEATYRSHEASGRDFDMESARRYGRRYRVDPIWLLHGIGAPSAKHGIRIVGIAGAGPDGSVVFSQESDADLGEAPWAPNVAADSVAVEVRGDSMRGIAEDGWLVYYDDRRDPPTDDLLGAVCVVWLSDGRVLVKKLVRGRKRGHFDLESAAAPTMHDQKVEFAAEVRAIVPRLRRNPNGRGSASGRSA